MTFADARAAYPVLARLAYLNAGTNGPLAHATVAAMLERTRRDLAEGRGDKPYIEEVLALREEVRSRIAGVLGVDADNVALTSSTTDSCNRVVAGLGLGPDDEIVTTDSEHFGLLGPIRASGARIRVARVRARPAAAAYDAIAAEITPRTRLLGLSHVSWHTGHVVPVEELERDTGLPLLVDGAQSAGAIPVAAAPFDFYAISCQKWLCGPDTTGALYVADPDALHIAAPTYFAQRSHDVDGSFVPKEGARRFDSGWLSAASLVGLLAALDTHPEWRFQRAAEMKERCRALLAERFDVVTEPGPGTLVAVRAPGDAAAAAERALAAGVVIRDLPGTGWLRVSCGYWTSEEDLERLVAALSTS